MNTERAGIIEQKRAELKRQVAQIKNDEGKESLCYNPSSAVLIGGGGYSGSKYRRLYKEAGIPVSSVVDTAPKPQTFSQDLPNAKYLQITDQNPLERRLEEALDGFPQAAVFITTPQGTHVPILSQVAPVLYERRIPVRIEKPLAASLGELQNFLELVDDPNKRGFLNQMVAGGYTLDKATPELIALGAFPADDDLLRHIKPIDPATPNFAETYGDADKNKREFGKLKKIGFHFNEGREDIRDVVGKKYGNRIHLAVYPGGGISADLIDHVVDKLVVLGYITPESRFSSVYVGYTPIGSAETSFPWPIPERGGLAETEAGVSMKTDNVPLVLSWGKRGPEFLGDKRKSTLYFENATLATIYGTNNLGQSNIFIVKTSDGQEHSYYVDVDPWILMLQRFNRVWKNSPGSVRGIYPQVLSSLLQEDIFNIWSHKPPIFFTADQDLRIRDQGLEQRHIGRMKRDEKVVRSILEKTK